MLFRPQKGTFKKSNLWKSFKGVSPWFWSKHRTFYHECFLWQIRRKKSFFYILNKQECFLDQKNGVLGKSKRSRFCKRVSPCQEPIQAPVHVLCQKIELLIMCVFLANQLKKYRFFIFSIKKKVF